MCILCVASKWSRRIVTMLPWLVIPLIILWALSQLLPPGFRFEVTSPRLACVAVLLVSLGWYELVMPKLSEWRSRRQLLLKEKRRVEAQEAAKLRKEATRRCRNCLAPYKDQTPGGGRFMCTNCGHVSKRPVLEVRGGPFSLPASVTGSAILSLRSSKSLNVRASQESSIFSQDRPYGNSNMNSSWFGGSWPGSGFYFGSEGSGWTGVGAFVGSRIFEGEICSTGESYFGVFWLALRVVSNLIFFVGWILRKLWRAAFPGEGGMGRSHQVFYARDNDVGPSPETRGEKARRKAEEKRLARLEKEQADAEERRQREEVARLVEERRRQRDEKLEAQKDSDREASVGKEREVKREKDGEKKRQDKVKEREKVQEKEKIKEQELEESKRKKGKDSEKRGETDKTDVEDLRSGLLISSECGKVVKGTKLDPPSKANEAGIKAATSNTSKNGSPKYLGSAKTSFWGRGFSAGSNPGSKSSKGASTSASLGPSPSNLTTGLDGKPAKFSGSAWNRTPWAIWGKAGHKVSDTNASHLEVVDSADRTATPCCHDNGKCLVDGAVVSASMVGVVRQPIAPPSSVQDLRDNLFSGPIGFPPVQLPVGTAYHIQAENVVHQVPYAPASTSVQSYFASSTLDAFPGTQVLKPCMCSDSTELHASTSLPSIVSSSSDMLDYNGTEIYDSLSQLDFMSSPVTSNACNDFRASVASLSPLDISQSTISSLPGSVDVMGCNPIELHQMLEHWNVPTEPCVSVSCVNDGPMKDSWYHWPASLSQRANTSQPFKWDAPFQQGIHALQPFNSALPDVSLSPELDSPFGLSSSQCLPLGSNRVYGEYFYSSPLTGSNNWVDSSPKELVVGFSEDADMNESIPPEFLDCITHSLMEDPVITADGHSYERSAIETWLKSHDTSPKTGEVLPPPPGRNGVVVDKTLRPNHILRGQIIEYRERIARGFGPHKGSAYPGWNMIAAATNSC